MNNVAKMNEIENKIYYHAHLVFQFFQILPFYQLVELLTKFEKSSERNKKTNKNKSGTNFQGGF